MALTIRLTNGEKGKLNLLKSFFGENTDSKTIKTVIKRFSETHEELRIANEKLYAAECKIEKMENQIRLNFELKRKLALSEIGLNTFL